MLSPGHAPAFGKPAGCPRPEGILQRVGLVPSTSPFADPTLRSVQRTRYLLRAPVRMSMRDLDKLRTPSESLWSPMGLDQELELTKLLRSQQERTLGALTRHTAPPCMRDLVNKATSDQSARRVITCTFVPGKSALHLVYFLHAL